MFNNEIKTLMFDLSDGREIFDAEQNRVISKAEANDVLRKACFAELGLNEKSTARDISRALKRDSARAFFEVIEEVLDKQITTGWADNEFFQQFVDQRNIADGDRNEFWTQDDIILEVANVSGSHHDLTLQKLNEGSAFSVPTSVWGIKVGSDIRLFLTGRKDWSEFLDAVKKAFQNKVMDMMYAETMDITSSLPAMFVKTGALVKANLDQLIDDVQTANNGVPVVIMGTKAALRNLTALAPINWIADSQKETYAGTGLMGVYEGTQLLEIPQRFKANDINTKLIASNVLMIVPQVDNKFVKFVDGGETTLEVTEVGDTRDDMQSYEVQRRLGLGTVVTRYMGVWTI